MDNFNGIECEKKLHNIKPDIIILGGSRIIKENIINIPKIGILNAHPGLLPKYRGVDIIPWAIHNGDDIGVTVHFIDKEVDTGDIIVQKIIEIEKYDTIKTLKSKAELLAAQLMVQVVLEIEKNGNVNRIPQLKSNGRQYYAMSTEILKNTEKILEGKKNELYNI
ncbi:MAG: formyl transferase [Candidatus Methanoperedens sp.]|nr:formyl transferase [Candidatus Methanoperedens sp.]